MDWTIPGILEKYGRHLDDAMRQMACSCAPGGTCTRIVDALLENPGKRIRPALVLGAHAALGGQPEEALPLAAAVEWIHTASLIHDDIEDLDHFRRGAPTVWRRFGVPHAINAGDRILSGALFQLASAGWSDKRLLSLLRMVLLEMEHMALGQELDLELEGHAISFADYSALCSGKTGALFRVCLAGPALLVKPENEDLIGRLQNAGTLLGELFQRRDDIADILGKKEGRTAGNDLHTGRATCLVAQAAQSLQGNARDTFFSLHAHARKHDPEETAKQMQRILAQEGVIAAVMEAWRDLARRFSENSKRFLPPELAYLLDDLRNRMDLTADPPAPANQGEGAP